MQLHHLKLSKEFMVPVLKGYKSFEFRHNDRGYQPGDIINFTHTDGKEAHMPPFCIEYVLDHTMFDQVPLGWVIFTIKKMDW